MNLNNRNLESGKTISVIICTYNRADLLRKCLDSLEFQLTGILTCEVIVVDGSSNDETKLLVAEYTARLPAIRYVYEEKQGHSNARNRGYYEACGDYLIYLDDDAFVPHDYLENVMQVISKYSPDIMGGPVYPYYNTPKPWWFRDEFEIRKYKTESGFCTRCGISGGNFIIRKHLLGTLGLFDSGYGMSGGKLGMLDERKVLETYRASIPSEQQRVYYSLECFVNHYTPSEKMRLRYILKRSFVAGKAQFGMAIDIVGHPNHVKGLQLILRGISKLFFFEIALTIAKFVKKQRTLFNLRSTLLKSGDLDFISSIIYGLTFIVKGLGYCIMQIKYYLNWIIGKLIST